MPPVHAGSGASKPSARNLDTAATLRWEMLKGEAGRDARLRFSEIYTDPERYGVAGDELVWHRSFGRPLNTVVLPAGWVLTNSLIPATIKQTGDGRIRLEFINPRADEIDVIITARRRPA